MLRHLPLGQEFVNYRDCVGFMEKDGGVNVKVLLKFNCRTDRFGLQKSIGTKPRALGRKSLKLNGIWIDELWQSQK